MKLKTEEILSRIKSLIKIIVRMVDNFPKKVSAFKIEEQIIDSVTSIGANFVEA